MGTGSRQLRFVETFEARKRKTCEPISFGNTTTLGLCHQSHTGSSEEESKHHIIYMHSKEAYVRFMYAFGREYPYCWYGGAILLGIEEPLIYRRVEGNIDVFLKDNLEASLII